MMENGFTTVKLEMAQRVKYFLIKECGNQGVHIAISRFDRRYFF